MERTEIQKEKLTSIIGHTITGIRIGKGGIELVLDDGRELGIDCLNDDCFWSIALANETGDGVPIGLNLCAD